MSTRRKRRAVVAAGICAAAIVAIVVLAVVLSKNVVYFRTVSEAVHRRHGESTSKLRIAGQVVPGTIHETGDGVRFDVTDGKATVAIVQHGDPPELFKECAPVVAEGRWGKGTAFDSDRILIKHGNEYTPPKVTSKASTGKACP